VRLHLGVQDIPYTNSDKTTGDVAQILESKYHVMEIYVEEVGTDNIAKAFEESARNALEDLISGAPAAGISLTNDAAGELEAAFRIFIDQKELDYVVPGVPTQASLKGVNHRFKRPYAKSNPVRPSFRDTGLYMASMRAWTEE